MAMVFQDPLTSLNRVYTVGNQIKETVRVHQGLRGEAADEAAIELLESVSIPDARRRLDEYPHQFSGGMRQRAVIAMARARDPDLLICDEPTTALDVTIQAQILELLQDLQDERDLSIIFITHDMGVIAEISDRVNVMYAGEIVESGPVGEIFENPAHPYTEGLLGSIPDLEDPAPRLQPIEGNVPSLLDREMPDGCYFADRCPKAMEDCLQPVPEYETDDSREHAVRCLLAEQEYDPTQALDTDEEEVVSSD